jgi:hypothetical protein
MDGSVCWGGGQENTHLFFFSTCMGAEAIVLGGETAFFLYIDMHVCVCIYIYIYISIYIYIRVCVCSKRGGKGETNTDMAICTTSLCTHVYKLEQVKVMAWQ